MDLRFTPEEQAFRAEVREFLKTSLPEELRRKLVTGLLPSKQDIVGWQQILYKRGWASPNWPVDCGGTGWDAVHSYIFREEIEKWPALTPASQNVSMIGPVIAHFGTPAQKERFLKRIANLDDWWCQGFSEPGAGSDLASLRTTAKREGDHWVVNGQKTWTTNAHHSNWMYTLCRTDPNAKKQEGISMLLIDMNSPGVVVTPIVTIDGAHEVNTVFLDDVKVPLDCLVGEENTGWDCAKVLLSNERTSTARIGLAKERLRTLKGLFAEEVKEGSAIAEDKTFRSKLAAVEVELKAHEMTTLRVLASERRRKSPGPDPFSSMLKIRSSEIIQRITELYVELAGPLSMPFQAEDPEGMRNNDEDFEQSWASVAAPTYFNRRKLSIYSGSNEIQRNILAKAVLGL